MRASDEARDAIRLIMLVNDVSLRALIPAELAKGFGFFQSKPSSAFSPVAVTPDELGDAWDGGKVHLPLHVDLNGKSFGRANAGIDMTFDFPTLIAHAAKTRPLAAGTIIGSGTVSNKLDGGPGKPVEDGGAGYSCIAEIRMIETIDLGAPQTPFHALRRHCSYRDEGRTWPFDLRRHRAAGNALWALGRSFTTIGDRPPVTGCALRSTFLDLSMKPCPSIFWRTSIRVVDHLVPQPPGSGTGARHRRAHDDAIPGDHRIS